TPAFAAFEGMVLDVLESPAAHYFAVRISTQPVGQLDRNARIVVRIWDTRTGVPLTHVKPPDGALLGAFSPHNRVLLPVTLGRTIQHEAKKRWELWGRLANADANLAARAH